MAMVGVLAVAFRFTMLQMPIMGLGAFSHDLRFSAQKFCRTRWTYNLWHVRSRLIQSNHPYITTLPTLLSSLPNPNDEKSAAIFEDSEENVWEEVDDGDEQHEESDENPTAEINDDMLSVEFQEWSQSLTKAVEFLVRKRDSLCNEVKKAEKLESTIQRAQLITSNMYLFPTGVTSAVVQDWENEGKELLLTLDESYKSASAEADALFQQARKLKRGSAIVKDLLQETNEALSMLEEINVDLNSCRLSEDYTIEENKLRLLQDRLIRTSRQTGFVIPSEKCSPAGTSSQKRSPKKPALGTPASNIRKLTSPGGCIVLVGRNRRGNEYLTFTIARGDDMWMHARGCPGAHVLIQQRRGSPRVTDECIQFAADLAVFYSDARSERSFDVTSAEPKHLLKPRGAPLGAVKLREEQRTYTGYPDQVDTELVLAREESGQGDEYRFFDKAKHRRRTQDNAKQEQAKKRQQARENAIRRSSSSSSPS